MKAMKKIIRILRLDAMTPEFKAANAELLKAIKMNDKSGAVPHADLEAINKAMKENDAEKVGAALKKVQLQFSKAEKKLDDEVKDVTARLAEAKKAVEKNKIDLKASKADAALFDKARKAADSIESNPRNASKLSPIADKLKKYGDLSKRASQIVTLASSNKDVSKQVDMLKKAIDTAEKKYKKESANVEKEAKKAKDTLDVLNMRVKVTQGKKDAFTKERLHIANVVKQMPGGDLRQKGGQKIDYNDLASKLYNQYSSLVDAAKKEVNKIVPLYKKQSFDYNAYTKQAKKEIWSAYESVASKHPAIAQILKGAYKYGSFGDVSSLIAEVVKAKNEIKGAGDDPKKYLGSLIGFIKEAKGKYEGSVSYPDGITANDASMINFHAEKNIDGAVDYLFDYVEPYKSKAAKLFNEYKALWEKAKSEKIKLPRSLAMFK